MGDTLSAGESLNRGEELESKNGRYRLVMEGDGDLVLYDGGMQSDANVVWSSDTSDLDPAMRPIRAEMGSDGHFGLYGDMRTEDGQEFPVWDIGRNSSPQSELKVQNDGQAVIYAGDGTALWASRPLFTEEQQRDIEEYLDDVLPKDEVRPGPLFFDSGWREVAFNEKIRTTGTLYSNGPCSVTIDAQNRSAHSGLRPQVVLSFRDAEGRRIWVSDVLTGKTYCAILDLSCPSSGPSPTINLNLPQIVGEMTVAVDISQFDGPDSAAFRRNLCIGLRAAATMVPNWPDALKQAILQILRC